MTSNNAFAPYIHTSKKSIERSFEWLVALIPVFVWSVFMFGARVVTLCFISASLSLLMDFLIQKFVFKAENSVAVDLMTVVYGILSAFMIPVTAPLWIPMISAVLVVVAKNLKGFYKKRLFNPFVFSSAVLNLLFPEIMTAFTKPFAYFNAFTFSLDPKLVAGYRCISPLQYMADGSVYEDGVLAQLYGYASGNIGEIAVTAIIISAIWLFVRREADWAGTLSMLLPILVLALAFPSDDAESNFYAYSVLLSGSIVFLSVFALNESFTVPMTGLGRCIVGLICGVTVFALRKFYGGFEYGYFVILVLNILSPFIEELTKPKVLNVPRKVIPKKKTQKVKVNEK